MKIENVKKYENKKNITEKILKELPEWFEIESSIKDYSYQVKKHTFFKASDKNKVIGFISSKTINKKKAEIIVMVF